MGGMDLKYGLSSSFTLDALIPDFGQVEFDNVELNLGPFQQQFDENEPFLLKVLTYLKSLTEIWGGSFFYSRRIGEKISLEDNLLEEDEQFYNFDSTPQILSTVKVTGTTSKNLSIGLLNAITNKLDVEIENFSSNETRKQTIQPLVNYNVLSLTKQLLNDYSSVGINTNKTGGDGLYGNNIAFVADMFDSNRDFNFKVKIFGSLTPKINNKNGFRYGISLSELKGNFRYNFSWWGVDKHYKQMS